MNTQELLGKILLRLNRFKLLVLLAGVLFGVLFFLYARSKPVIYSVKSTVFPLTSGPDNKSSQSKLTELLGGSGGSGGNLSDEANVNIEEVGRSKKTRDAVAAETLPAYGNKTIAEVLIIEYNKTRSFPAAAIAVPKDRAALISKGAELLGDPSRYSIKFNKLSLLEILVSSTDQELLVPISNILIEKISLFYKELKIEKAQFDLGFIQAKLDSLGSVLKGNDRRRIILNNTTLFVPKERLQYSIPQENLEADKLLILSQRNGAAANREEALWRLQKVTPIIKTLDSPGPPFSESKPSAILYAAAGFILGCLLFAFLLIAGIFYRYAGDQLQASISTGTAVPPTVGNTSTTA